MAISPSVNYNGGLLPDTILLLTLCYDHRGTQLNAINTFCLYSQCSPLKISTFSPSEWVDAQNGEGLDRFSQVYLYIHLPPIIVAIGLFVMSLVSE